MHHLYEGYERFRKDQRKFSPSLPLIFFPSLEAVHLLMLARLLTPLLSLSNRAYFARRYCRKFTNE